MKKTQEQISYNMSRIKNKDSAIEVILRKELWARGIHYRKNVKSILGKPDIAFVRKKIAVFCDSEFWHGYDWETRKSDFKSHQEFWIPQIEKNIRRDIEVNEKPKNDGWAVIRFWGCDIYNDLQHCAEIIKNTLSQRKG